MLGGAMKIRSLDAFGVVMAALLLVACSGGATGNDSAAEAPGSNASASGLDGSEAANSAAEDGAATASESADFKPDYLALSKEVRSRTNLPSDWTDGDLKKWADYLCAKNTASDAIELLQNLEALSNGELPSAIAAGTYQYVCPEKSDVYEQYLARSS